MKFYENPQQGVVVAQKERTQNGAIQEIKDFVRHHSKYFEIDWAGRYLDDLIMPRSYRGVARCNLSEDTYVPEIGESIAERRCNAKYRDSIDKRWIKVLNDLYGLADSIEKMLLQRGVIEFSPEPLVPNPTSGKESETT